MASSSKDNSGSLAGAGLNDLIDTQALRFNKDDAMNNSGTLIDVFEGTTRILDNTLGASSIVAASLEGTQEAPILLDTTVDHTITMAFLQRPEIFAGRAILASAVPTETSDAVTLDHVQSSAETATTTQENATRRVSTGAGPSNTLLPPSPPHFTPNRCVSLISRALDLDDLSTQTVTTTDLELSIFPTEYNTSDSDLEANSEIGTGADIEGSTPCIDAEDSPWRTMFPLIDAVVPLNAESTTLVIEGEHYQIPNSDLWLFSYNKDQVMVVDDLAELIRAAFYENIERLGAEEAIKRVNGNRISAFEAASSPPNETITADSDATGIESENKERIDGLPVALSSFPLCEQVSNKAGFRQVGSDSSNAASDNSTVNNYVSESFEMDGTLEKTPRPLLSPVHLLRSGSRNSVNTVGNPHSDTEDELDEDELSRFVDIVRAALPNQCIADEDFEQLTKIIDLFLEPEYCGEGADKDGQLGLVARIRFDKLLEDFAHLKTVNAEYKGLVGKASSLQRLWKERFRGDYLLIDRERLKNILAHGALHNLTLRIDAKTKVPFWHVRRGPPNIGADLKPGRFWLNIEAAYRDGIIESNLEKLTPGKYDRTPTLPLLTGTEVDEQPGRTRYRKQCRAKDMPYNLMTKGEHFQGKIRILRGHELVSKHAPKAGVRYDGEYLITGWTHLPTPHLDVDIRHFELVLERIPGQPSYLNIPSPAQLDDWHLYQRYITTQKTVATSAYSNLLTDEKQEADRLTDVANTEWDEIISQVSDAMEMRYNQALRMGFTR